MLKIAIIDSGVNCYHSSFGSKKPTLVCGRELYSKQKDFYGHGTAIYNIIRKVEDIAEIVNFKIEHIEDGVNESELIDMLSLISREYEFDIINLSLGLSICENLKKLEAVCNELFYKGTIIVSAFDNVGSISYPAAFRNVIGVTTGELCSKIDDFEYVENSVINLCAKGVVQRVAWNNPDYIMLGGNSFACAHVTVQVAKFMSQGLRRCEDILNAFKKKSKKVYLENREKNTKQERIPYEIRKAVIFPFNKEMHSLVRFRDMLSFEIVGVYDSKYSGNVGVSTKHILKDCKESIVIENIENLDWDIFDTMIVGHMDVLSGLINKFDLRKKIIKEAISRKKNIYSFDPIDINEIPANIFFPQITKDNLPSNKLGKLYRISKPILGIYGTSSRQGKFTTQLYVREEFIKLGYKVGQIGTEPSALLFGMDYVYPMGYNNSVYIQDYDVINYLNDKMNKMSNENVDIIITGSQSGVVPYDIGNIAQYSLPQMDFLFATQPDVIVLCINTFDEFEYIERTIKCLEACANCEVIAFVVIPVIMKDNWLGIYGQKERMTEQHFNEFRQKVQERFGRPLYQIGNKSHSIQLVQTIIDYFK